MVGDRLLREQHPPRVAGAGARREQRLEQLRQARRVGSEHRVRPEALDDG